MLAEKQRLLPITLAQAVGLVCGVLGVRIVSHLVDPAALGAYGVFLTFTTIGTWIVYSGLTKFVGRVWAAGEQDPLRRIVLRTWKRKLVWVAVGAAIATAVIAVLTPLNRGVVFAAVFISAAALSVAGLGQSALQAARRNWHDLATSAVGSVTRTFIPPLAYSVIGSVGLYAGFTLHAVCFGGVAVLCVLRTKRPNPAAVPAALAPVYEGALFTTLAIIGWVLASENRWLAISFFGDVTAGYFTLGSNIALIVPSIVGAILLQFQFPRFYRIGDRATFEARTQLARDVDVTAVFFVALAGLGVALVRLVSPWLIGPLIDARYASSIEWLVPAGCFGIATTTSGFYHTLLLASRRERGCGPADVWTAVILTAGSVITATVGNGPFKAWLTCTPIVPWVVTRTIARKYVLKLEPVAAPAPVP